MSLCILAIEIFGCPEEKTSGIANDGRKEKHHFFIITTFGLETALVNDVIMKK